MTLTTNYTPSIDPRDIQTRKELINGIETTEDMQSPDTNGDPEGSENRANRVEFADFLLENHFASMQNTWGKPWGTVSVRDNKTGNYVKHNFDDGNPHLVPTSLYIEEVMQAHKMIMEMDYVHGMCSMAKSGDCVESDYFQAKIKAVASTSTTLQWREYEGILASLQHFLAIRAIKRYTYDEIVRKNDSGESTDRQDSAREQAESASVDAGQQYLLLEETQKIRGKQMPDFFSEWQLGQVERAIQRQLQDTANYLEVNYGSKKQPKPKQKDWDLLKF